MKTKRILILWLVLALCTVHLTAVGEELCADTAETIVAGEGSRVFSFLVKDLEGNETQYEIHTDCETVGEALLALGLIEGDAGPYGLYVKSVNGLRLSWEENGHYWAFYINGEYAMSGVDTTLITDGDSYAFIAE